MCVFNDIESSKYIDTRQSMEKINKNFTKQTKITLFNLFIKINSRLCVCDGGGWVVVVGGGEEELISCSSCYWKTVVWV